MAVLADAAAGIDYGVYDADEHYYEAEDALTRHLDHAHRHVVRWADIGGRRTLVVNGKLVTVVPNPTYDPVGVPGSLEQYFRADNSEGIEIRDIIKMHPIQPEYRDREMRLARMDSQGVAAPRRAVRGILIEWRSPRSHGRHVSEPYHAGLYRTAVGVDDTRKSYEAMTDAGWHFDRQPMAVELHGTPVPEMWICFLSDPDGVPFEFVERPRSAFK